MTTTWVFQKAKKHKSFTDETTALWPVGYLYDISVQTKKNRKIYKELNLELNIITKT